MPRTNLDLHAAQPLSSSEIRAVLGSIIGGIVIADPDARIRIPDVLELVRVCPAKLLHPACSSWETALAATVAGLREWCAAGDIDTAIRSCRVAALPS